MDPVQQILAPIIALSGGAASLGWAYGMYLLWSWVFSPTALARDRVRSLRATAAQLRRLDEVQEADRLTAEADQIERELALGAAHKILPRVEGDDR